MAAKQKQLTEIEGSELMVTGVSRSGRVRKKSSKLTDFQSSDEVEKPRKKHEKTDSMPTSSTPKKKLPSKLEVPSDEDDLDDLVDSMGSSRDDQQFSESDTDNGFHESSLESLGSGSELEDDDANNQSDNNQSSEGFQRINPSSPETMGMPSQAQSLYMLEKSNKRKLIIRDGRIVGRAKAQRKDKGKTRFTAYMLWAKEIRQELMRANPELDFSQTSKRLGELWATVPYNEKYIWRRKAKRLASKGVKIEKPPSETTSSPKKKSVPARKFINKQSGKGVAASQSAQLPSQSTTSATSLVTPPVAKGGRSSLVAEPVVGPGMYKVVGTQPIDVAAHLRLLGESLIIIGERLKEHEGQIAVSGSLSVLLDSLLCALGPLLCLTQEVPEFSTACTTQTLTKILDNIAYIMPGL